MGAPGFDFETWESTNLQGQGTRDSIALTVAFLSGKPEERKGDMKALWVVLGIVGVLILAVLMVFGSYVSAKNQMVSYDQNVKASWSEVDVQLERRADLIPNLVETVKGFTKEESTVFGDIANARAGLLNAQGPAAKIAANGTLDSAFGRLLALTENYPQLRSSDQFMRLQDELAGTENRISVARKRYNDALQTYNTFVLQFPNSIWAGIAGFKQNSAYFTASPAAQQVPNVKF
jgi:LemA protein